MGLNKAIWDITERDLVELIETGVREGRTVEYKRQLLDDDAGRRKFLAEVSSLANTAGGHIFIGIDEEEGEPRNISGLEVENPDSFVQQLDNRLRNSIDPRLPSVDINTIPLENGRLVVVVRLDASLIGPHMVTYKGHERFYGRNSNGKYPLDVTELRSAFVRSATFAERARKWREVQLAREPRALSTQYPDRFVLVLHVVPFAAFEPGAQIDVAALSGAGIQPLGGSLHSSRYNFDGLLTMDTVAQGSGYPTGYAQFYREGCIEAAQAIELAGDEGTLLPIVEIERILLEGTEMYLGELGTQGVSPPAAVMVSVLNVRNCRVPAPYLSPQPAVDRDELPTPEITINQFKDWRGRQLKPAFDTIWNAGGHPACPHFTEDGIWDPAATRL